MDHGPHAFFLECAASYRVHM